MANSYYLYLFILIFFILFFYVFGGGWDRRGCFSDSICEIMPVGLLREHKIFLHSRLITVFVLLVMTNDPSCSSIIIVAA